MDRAGCIDGPGRNILRVGVLSVLHACVLITTELVSMIKYKDNMTFSLADYGISLVDVCPDSYLAPQRTPLPVEIYFTSFEVRKPHPASREVLQPNEKPWCPREGGAVVEGRKGL